jgi:hypothetical protein
VAGHSPSLDVSTEGMLRRSKRNRQHNGKARSPSMRGLAAVKGAEPQTMALP